MSIYLDYYEDQFGGGGSSLKTIYSGARYQRGRGIGAWLGGLLRGVVPYITQGMKTVGREALRTGMDVYDDVASGNATFKDSIRARGRESGVRLKRKAKNKIINLMSGNGYKARTAKRRRQSRKKRQGVRKTASFV